MSHSRTSPPFRGPELLGVRRFAWSEPYAWRLPVSLWLEVMASALEGGWVMRVSRRRADAMRRALERSGAALGEDVEEALERMLAGAFVIQRV